MLLFVVGMVGFNFQLTLAVLAKTVFATGPQQFGLLTTALAVGALAGALASGGRRSRPSVYVVLGSAIAFGALETLVGIGPSFWLTAALLVPTGFFMIFFAQATNQRIQLGVDGAYRGRVMALFVLVFLGTDADWRRLSIGFLSEHFGPRVGIWGGGLVSAGGRPDCARLAVAPLGRAGAAAVAAVAAARDRATDHRDRGTDPGDRQSLSRVRTRGSGRGRLRQWRARDCGSAWRTTSPGCARWRRR